MAKPIYLAQRKGTGEVLGVNGDILPIWKVADNAAQFSSRLSCYQRLDQWLAANGGYTTEYDEDPFTVRKVLLDAEPLVKVDPNVDIPKLIEQISEWHDVYCLRVAEWVRDTCGVKDPARPTPQICLVGEKHSGVYRPRDHTCTYTLTYPMIYGIEPFKETIAHEVVHAYQNHFSGCGAGHGGDFFGMMKHAAKYPTIHYKHSFNVQQSQELAKSLVAYYKRAIVKGEFATTAVKVLTDLDMGGDDID